MKTIITILLAFLLVPAFSQPDAKVKTGDKIIDFKVLLIDSKEIPLNELYGQSPIVLVVLRGWPEYQCPICTRQVGELVAEADQFKSYGAKVLMIYPGPSEVLREKAEEFTEDITFPEGFYFALDPNYLMVNKYGLRWDAPKETAYPSTFVIDKGGEVVFAKVSSGHGGRADVEEVMAALKGL
ncbi:peroxiredoxin family protein [Draconibacterium halophilum]|uniref:thioredoxin-dependent peroxiredoxin n=1 Tax=Draconibacterium halophilum TaxID=2706887 RepID=A0A6C0RBK3_9BACT|nr:peroxiredoxin family protein [Draconibacterium halophilum]QIA06853.1 peroxiredoxin family protein [Draconibacterium halophilum]